MGGAAGRRLGQPLHPVIMLMHEPCSCYTAWQSKPLASFSILGKLDPGCSQKARHAMSRQQKAQHGAAGVWDPVGTA